VVARLKAELAEEIQARIARVKTELEAEILARAEPVPGPREFERFSWNFRAQHWLLLTSCLTLIVTGLPLKFHEARISQLFFDLVGGVRVSTLIHRIGAVGLIVVGGYHLFYLAAFREGRKNFLKLEIISYREDIQLEPRARGILPWKVCISEGISRLDFNDTTF
jgi:hypothetical protein